MSYLRRVSRERYVVESRITSQMADLRFSRITKICIAFRLYGCAKFI
jgi:hypothetical protein